MTTDPQPTAETHEAAESVGASSRPKLSLPSKPIQLTIGVGIIALLVGGGAGFGLAQIGDSTTATSSSSALTLPSTLSGGLSRNATVDTTLKASLTSERTALGAGVDAALYTSGNTRVIVEAARIGGGGVPASGATTYAKVGDAICVSSASSSASGTICTRSGNTLTVKVTASDQATALKYVDEVYNAVA